MGVMGARRMLRSWSGLHCRPDPCGTRATTVSQPRVGDDVRRGCARNFRKFVAFCGILWHFSRCCKVGWLGRMTEGMPDWGGIGTCPSEIFTVFSPYQILWIPAFAGMTGSGWGRNWVVQQQGGFQTCPYQVVASLPFNTRVACCRDRGSFQLPDFAWMARILDSSLRCAAFGMTGVEG